ncbi:MAG: helix-turn-helix domain-containing protein [Proteobacteria bacterium]|nr:helix-turn-helix domain-containing protein [Pseudomonadota bacterium]OEU68705.1 MAG: XRE family transcriptional regulator [Desulfobacterales bacterium S5133MH16]
MLLEKLRVASGVSQLDHLLGGLYIGDNVVWYDDAGSLAAVYCLNFIQASQAQNRPLIYVSFDRSPKNLLEKLGALAQNNQLIILDCFTYGKGSGSEVFLKFYENKKSKWPCQIIRVDEPRQINQVMDSLYGIHATLVGDVRFVFESLTGMQELWGGEENLINFYSHSCPRLYELNTIAYWIIEKRAHSPRLRAQINQIAQVAIDLSVKRGKTSLTILKAEKRDLDTLNKPFHYWSKDLKISFDSEKRSTEWFDLGKRLKEFRTKRGLSQTELAKLVGVTPSTISQVESNLIYPSLPALLKMAEVLAVELSSFFTESVDLTNRMIFPEGEAVDIKLPSLPEGNINAKLLTPVDFKPKAEPYLLEIQPKKSLPAHFFIHKGEEIGYLLSGKLQLKLEKSVYNVRSGDVIYFTSEVPSQWKNPGPSTARLLWIKIK